MHLFVVEIEVVQWEGAVDKKLNGNKTKAPPREGGRVSSWSVIVTAVRLEPGSDSVVY